MTDKAMTRTDRQQLVRDAAWRLNTPEKLARLTPAEIGALGSAISRVLGWGDCRVTYDRAAATIRNTIAKLDGSAEVAN